MNVLFIYTNINGYHADCYSFGLASIVSITKSHGHTAEVIILRKEDEIQHIQKRIRDFKPKVIGFSSVSSQFGFVKTIAAEIKKNFPEIITVCGGVHPTINPQCLLETEYLDAIFIGESEYSFVEFLDKVKESKDYRDIDNLGFKKDGNVIINVLKPLIKNLDELPYPDRESYPYIQTIKNTGLATFFFSRGCPYLCSYCSNHVIAQRYGLQRNAPRYRSAESSIKEIEATIKAFDAKTVWICDDIFGLNKEWREEFCEKYKKRVKIKFICVLRVNVIDQDFMKLLKDAGCFRIFIGIESGNSFIREKIMNRNMTNEQIKKAFKVAHGCGLDTNAINMIGLPDETEEMLWDTIRLNRQIKPTISCVNIFYPYRGTKLGDYCFKEGLVNEKLYYSFSNERRESVLNYPESYKKKLIYYRENWELLIYPYSFSRHFMRYLKNSLFWKILRKLKHFCYKG